MTERERILSLIAINRDTKAPGWKKVVKKCVRRLELMEDPYWEHEDVGTEMRGRKPLPPQMSFGLPCPEDDYSERSYP
jgi:hypothetical protein